MPAGMGLGKRLAEDVRQHPMLLGVVFGLVLLLLYGAVGHHEFLQWDDNQYVTENPHVATGISLMNIRWAFTEIGIFYWHPVTWLSHMLDCQVFGVTPGPQHLINLLLHSLNVLLLFFLLQKATLALWRSAMVAALFAFHPLNVESVAWLAERKSLLSVFFSLLTLAAYGLYVRERSWKRYAIVVCLFAVALMSKPMAVTLPVLMLALDYWPLNRVEGTGDAHSWGKLLLEKIPLLVLSVGSSVLTLAGQRAAGAMSTASEVPMGMRAEQALWSYLVYLGKLFWPTNLSPFYPYHPHGLGAARIAMSVLVLVGVTLLLLRLRHHRYGIAGWLWFLAALFPVIGVVQAGRVVIGDRFVYFPAIGMFVAVVWMGGEMIERRRIPPAVPAAASIATLVALSVATANYVGYWKNGVMLFERAAAVEKTPDPMIEDMIADALVKQGRIDEALARYQRSCELDPRFDLCHYNIAEILFSRYQVSAALEHYQLAGRYTNKPGLALNCLVNSGEALIALGNLDGAEQQLRYALSMDPAHAGANRLMQEVRARRGQ